MSENVAGIGGDMIAGIITGLTGFVFMALGIFMVVFADLIIADWSKDYVPGSFLVLAVFGAVFLLSLLARALTMYQNHLKDPYF